MGATVSGDQDNQGATAASVVLAVPVDPVAKAVSRVTCASDPRDPGRSCPD